MISEVNLFILPLGKSFDTTRNSSHQEDFFFSQCALQTNKHGSLKKNLHDSMVNTQKKLKPDGVVGKLK